MPPASLDWRSGGIKSKNVCVTDSLTTLCYDMTVHQAVIAVICLWQHVPSRQRQCSHSAEMAAETRQLAAAIHVITVDVVQRQQQDDASKDITSISNDVLYMMSVHSGDYDTEGVRIEDFPLLVKFGILVLKFGLRVLVLSYALFQSS